MSDDKEYQKWDSDSEHVSFAARLAKDAEVVETKNGEMTKITFVDTSSGEEDLDMWIEAVINDGQAEKAQGLLKGDVIPCVRGKLTAKMGKDGDKVFFNLKRTRLHFGVALLTELKERSGGKKPAGKGAAKGAKPSAKKPAKSAAKPARPIIEDDEDDSDDGEE